VSKQTIYVAPESTNESGHITVPEPAWAEYQWKITTLLQKQRWSLL